MARSCIMVMLLLLALLALAAAQKINPCDTHHWDELSGHPQTDPDRPCNVQYSKSAAIKKRRLVLQRQKLAQQQAAQGAAPAEVVPPETAASAPGAVQAQAIRTATTVTPLALNGGNLVVTTTIQAIFWGSSWGSTGTTTFAGDKITGLSRFFAAHNASRYADTCAEYPGANGNHPTSATKYLGYIIDTTSTSSISPGSTSTIGSKVCAKITNPVPDMYVPVFLDKKRGSRGYCAWHSYGWCSGGKYNSNGIGTPITFGMHFNVDGDSGCDITPLPGQSQGLASLANLAAHELEETRTDPYGSGYWDASGAENGDKCAWTFNRIVTLSDGSQWKLQGEWSNAAFAAGTGYDSNKGCVDGA